MRNSHFGSSNRRWRKCDYQRVQETRARALPVTAQRFARRCRSVSNQAHRSRYAEKLRRERMPSNRPKSTLSKFAREMWRLNRQPP